MIWSTTVSYTHLDVYKRQVYHLYGIQRILIHIPSTSQPNRVRGDIPPLQRIVVPVTVIVQPRLLIILLPRQPVRLVQVMRVLLIKLVAPFIILRCV